MLSVHLYKYTGFRVQSIITKFHTESNGLIKQLFTPDAYSVGRALKIWEGSACVGSKPRVSAKKKNVLIFTKWIHDTTC